MLFKSALLTQASGSVGGTTASHNKGGMYFRARTVPVNPASAFQVAVRNAVTILTNAWENALTQVQRDAWQVYADNVTIVNRLGDAKNISGINQYIRSNVPRLQSSLARVDDGPTNFNLGDFTEPAFTGNAGADTVDVTFTDSDDWAAEPGSALLVFISRPQNSGIRFFAGPYRLAGNVEGSTPTPPTSPATLGAPFPFAVGNRLFGKFSVTRADGRLSGMTRSTVLAS